MQETTTSTRHKSNTALAAATFGVAATAFQDPAHAALYEIKISALVTQSAIPYVPLNETIAFNYVLDTNTPTDAPGQQFGTYAYPTKRFSVKSAQVDSKVILANDVTVSNNPDRDFVSISFTHLGTLPKPLSAYFDFYDSQTNPANTLSNASLSEVITKLSQFANKNVSLIGDNFSFGGAQVQSVQVSQVNLTSIAGDFNGDQKVDSGDLLQWKHDYGTTTKPYADFNGDSMADGADFLGWQRTFGNTASAAVANPASDSSNHTIPEPSGSSLVVTGALFLAAARKTIERIAGRLKKSE